jgi:hypothetical protein
MNGSKMLATKKSKKVKEQISIVKKFKEYKFKALIVYRCNCFLILKNYTI